MATPPDPETRLMDWLNDHPGTIFYIAIMVTACVILQAVQVFQ